MGSIYCQEIIILLVVIVFLKEANLGYSFTQMNLVVSSLIVS